MSATSFNDVSLIAIVPESEWRMPTLIGPVGLPAGAATVASAFFSGSLVASAFVSGPLQPAPSAQRAASVTDIMCFMCAYSCAKGCLAAPGPPLAGRPEQSGFSLESEPG